MEEVAHVAFACRGTLVDWTSAINAVAYELARRNGESLLDRGGKPHLVLFRRDQEEYQQAMRDFQSKGIRSRSKRTTASARS